MEPSKKEMADFRVVHNRVISPLYSLLMLRPDGLNLADMDIRPGQFVQVMTPNRATYLRRPISVCNVDSSANLLWLLVRNAGPGTDALCKIAVDAQVNIIIPLGNGFTVNDKCSRHPLLVGGGVGVAPLLYLGRRLADRGVDVRFLLGARSDRDLLLLDEFQRCGEVYISTEDGSAGEKGLVTANSALSTDCDMIYCCGPMPMMKAVAAIARQQGVECEVSLENVMACGVGACLCCVEKTVEGNLCVCKEGPVFNINRLLWHD